MDLLLDIFLDAVMDTVKLVPFLFLTYLAMEYLENKAGEKTVNMLLGAGKKGPIIGGILGVVPQCGFSAAAASLYSGGVITVGTMIAVFLSTSDEMLPILISERAKANEIFWILGVKIFIGVTAGIFADITVRMRNGGRQKGLRIHEICERDHCHCEEGSILKSAVTHSLQTVLFIFLVTFALNGLVGGIGMEHVVRIVAAHPVQSILLTTLIGLIPNCASSVMITTFYLEGILSVGSMLAGLLSCAGVGLLVLFRTNKNWRANLIVTVVMYGVSVFCGLAAEVVFRCI